MVEILVKHCSLYNKVLYTILAVKNLSAVSSHPSGPSISVFREKRKKAEERCAVFLLETVTLVKKKNSLRSESKPTAPTFCVFFFGETVLMRRFKTLASAYKCPEMP